VAAWAAGPSAKEPNGKPGRETRWWQALVVLLALACLWELFGLESWLGARARAMARAQDFYYSRAVLQKVVISVAVAATVLLLPFIRRARSSHRLVLVSLILYLAISAVNLVSLHVIDKVADLSWHGVSLVQALKLGCATMTLLGVRRVRRTG
jgi:signal transduction histidine kinase